MTGALFMPLMFRSEEGEILFNGTPISDEAAKTVRDMLRTAALDLSKTQEAADVFWTLCGQVRAALSDAIDQRTEAAKSASLRVVSINQPPHAA